MGPKARANTQSQKDAGRDWRKTGSLFVGKPVVYCFALLHLQNKCDASRTLAPTLALHTTCLSVFVCCCVVLSFSPVLLVIRFRVTMIHRGNVRQVPARVGSKRNLCEKVCKILCVFGPCLLQIYSSAAQLCTFPCFTSIRGAV